LSPFEAADLIGREARALDIGPVKRMIQGRRVLVTGAGGSIGSELSQQIAALSPSTIVLVDNSEFNLLGETNPIETLRNNVGGTKNIINLSLKYKALSFTLISTDKAVNPSNIMGASKLFVSVTY